MRKYIIIGVVAILGVGSVIYFYSSQHTLQVSHHIILTETGFSPQTITIAKGDTVIFTTTRGKQFWPASDLHPTHEIYAEFDPKRPLVVEESWSFRFERTGEWRFHDHLDSFFRGTITVTDTQAGGSGIVLQNACSKDADMSYRLQCWQNIIQQHLQGNNLDAAFAALDAFTKQNPAQLDSCHGMVHEIGEQAFRLFNQNKDFVLSPKTSYCGYGFYHGFMETLMHTTNDMAQARAFCDYADEKLKYFIADAGGACIHGIGHGSVDDVPDPSSWGDMQAIVQPALVLCEQVSMDESQLFRCASGAFNALEILSDSGKYGLSADHKDPFSICRRQPEQYKRACYTQFLVAAMLVANNDFTWTAKFIDTIEEDAYAQETLAGLAVERARLQETDYGATMQWCRSLADRFHIPCITGFAEGFLKYGPPEAEYVRAIDFCGSKLLSGEERRPCFDRVLSILRNFTTVAKAREICFSVEPQYRYNNCQYD